MKCDPPGREGGGSLSIWLRYDISQAAGWSPQMDGAGEKISLGLCKGPSSGGVGRGWAGLTIGDFCRV